VGPIMLIAFFAV